MKNYTGWQWLLIDAANNFGLDKLIFEKRIEWAENNLSILETLVDVADTKPLFIKAVMAIRKAQQGTPTGHMVGVDAVCSGTQIMSVLTGCVDGARATGLIDPDVRADAYTSVTDTMAKILGNVVTVVRSKAKQAFMTVMYGSKQEPLKIFGEETPELAAFYEASQQVAPGAWELLQDLLASWQPFALLHQWKLPDGFDARVKVMKAMETRIEVDELDHATFTYEYYDNEGSKKGLSNVANCIHSVDAYVLRAMHRRCNYDADMVNAASEVIEAEMLSRTLGSQADIGYASNKVAYYVEQYNRSTVSDVVILPHLTHTNVCALSTEHLKALAVIIDGMLQYKPFPLVTVHDEFKAHANNINWVRWQYKEILAELADSNLLDDLLSQIMGEPGTFQKLSFNLGDQIRKSNYALC